MWRFPVSMGGWTCSSGCPTPPPSGSKLTLAAGRKGAHLHICLIWGQSFINWINGWKQRNYLLSWDQASCELFNETNSCQALLCSYPDGHSSQHPPRQWPPRQHPTQTQLESQVLSYPNFGLQRDPFIGGSWALHPAEYIPSNQQIAHWEQTFLLWNCNAFNGLFLNFLKV